MATTSRVELRIPAPSEKQALFLRATEKYVAYGGARGGGKSWAVRTKAEIMALRHAGIRQLIVRRSYPELQENHIRQLRAELLGVARYNEQKHVLTFPNGSTINFVYCAKDKDVDNLQGQEYDMIYIDEATQLSEYQIKVIAACCRGVNGFPKRVYLTCNPGGRGHAYVKRLFVDRKFVGDEKPEDYRFIQALVTDNKVLMESDPEYVRRLEVLPPKLRKAWLEGLWDILEGQFFEEFRDDPEHYADRIGTHVIAPFTPPAHWPVFRSYDHGYAKPFSVGWWTADEEGRLYRILELYGSTGEPNVGLKWDPATIFDRIREIESEHPWLRGKQIRGVADPAIWDADSGESVAETAAKRRVYFEPGDHKRLTGWMQVHYRLAFDREGKPRMYFFNSCKDAIRTLPLLEYDLHKAEDLDTDGEDHAADEIRYLCMARPVPAPEFIPERTAKTSPALWALDLREKDLPGVPETPGIVRVT